MAGVASLVGRADLLERASAWLDEAHGGVVLVGEGGVGKSRLATEIVRMGADRGFHAVSTVGTQAAAAIPLGALSHLLPDLSASSGNVLMAARAALAEQAGSRRLLLSIDDAHLLDDHSATLVLQLAMAMPSFVVATVRSGEPVPDAVLALWKEGLAERVEIGPLDPASIEALAAAVLGGPIDPVLARAVRDRAAGNALFARELCLAGRDAGVIVEADSRWVLEGSLGVSARLIELVRARVDGLPPGERAALDVIAHAEPIGQRLALESGGAAALLALEQRGLIVVREDGRRRELWLSHPMYADVLRAMTGPLAAVAIKERLAAVTSATGMRRRSDVLRVATWQLDAGSGDPELLRRAATETYRAGDMGGTARLAAGAWDLRPDAHIAVVLGTALAYTGRYAEADAIFASAAELALDESSLSRIAIVHAAILSAGMGRPDAAIALLADVEERVSGPDELAILRGQRAHLLALSGDVRGALALAEPLLAGPDEGPVFVTAAMAAVIALQQTGEYERVVAIVDRATEETTRLWSAGVVSIPPEMLELTAYGAGASMGQLRDLPVNELHGDAARIATALQNRPVAILTALHAASVAFQRGRPRTAANAIEGVGPQETDLLGSSAMTMLAMSAALVDAPAAARASLDRAAAWRRPGSIWDPFVEEATPWVLVAEGRPEHARRSAKASLDAAIAAGRWGQAMELAHLLARIGGLDAASDAMTTIGDRVDGALAAARRAHVEGMVHGSADRLEAVATTFATIGAFLLAAEAAADASRAARRDGDPRRAVRLARLASEHAARCEGAQTPILRQPANELSPLSRRELEIADLAASGLSSEAIAERLFLSVRTVDNHLQHVYQKLGIGSRAELARAMGGQSDSPA